LKRIIKNHERVLLIILFIISLAMLIFTFMVNRYNVVWQVGDMVIENSAICGIIQSIMVFCAILAVIVDYDIGFKNTMFIFGVQVLMAIINGIRMRNLAILPGLFNVIVSIFAIALIARQFKASEKESKTDLVTGLLNRRGFEDILQWKISKKQSGYIVYFALNNLRMINENLGHRYGDIVLKEVAGRIQNCLGDKGIVCKNDGAEYLILISDKHNPLDVIEKVMKAVGEKMVVTKDDIGINYFLTASAGIASFPKDSNDTQTLLKYADIAMVDATHRGAGHVSFFDSNLAKSIVRQQEVERLIKDSLENDNFYLVYQPQYEIGDKKLRGFETLIRMKPVGDETIYPSEFIAIAEKTDLIYRIDEYVLKRAMWEFGSIIKNSKQKAVLSINVSAKAMALKGFADSVKKIIAETDFPAEYLEIEITEYSFSESEERTVENIKILKEVGVKIALDDFGTGYTSLAQLLKLPIDLLKIDKSLIDGIENSQVNKDFVDAIIYMGHLMECEVISEGVEDMNQVVLLRQLKCDFVQGYVWNKPLAYEVAAGML